MLAPPAASAAFALETTSSLGVTIAARSKSRKDATRRWCNLDRPGTADKNDESSANERGLVFRERQGGHKRRSGQVAAGSYLLGKSNHFLFLTTSPGSPTCNTQTSAQSPSPACRRCAYGIARPCRQRASASAPRECTRLILQRRWNPRCGRRHSQAAGGT